MIKTLLIFLMSLLQLQNCQQNDILHDQLQEFLKDNNIGDKQNDSQFQIQETQQFQMTPCFEIPKLEDMDYSYQEKFQKKKLTLIPEEINQKCNQTKRETFNQAELINEETIEENQQAAEEICEIFEKIHEEINKQNQQEEQEIFHKDEEIHQENLSIQEKISQLAEQIYENDKIISDTEEIGKNPQLAQVEINKQNQMFYQILSYIKSKDQDNCVLINKMRKCKK